MNSWTNMASINNLTSNPNRTNYPGKLMAKWKFLIFKQEVSESSTNKHLKLSRK